MIGSILVADDDQSFATILKTFLESKGHRVQVVGDGLAAAMQVFDHKPNLVILDIKMPGPYGISVWESLQHDHETARIPVIFVSGVIDEEALRKRIPAGGRNRFVQKPVDLSELHGVINELMDRKAAA